METLNEPIPELPICDSTNQNPSPNNYDHDFDDHDFDDRFFIHDPTQKHVEQKDMQIKIYDNSRYDLHACTDAAYFVEGTDSIASVLSASNDEILQLHAILQRYWSSSTTTVNSLSSINKFVYLDAQTQIFGLRKVCSCIKASNPSVRVWLCVVRSICAAVTSFLFFSSDVLPIKCARYVLGSVYRNALSACILSEVLDTAIVLLQFFTSSTTNSETDNFIQFTIKKLALSIGGIVFATALPTPLLSGHCVVCVSHLLVDTCANILKNSGAKQLKFMYNRLVEWRARVRLSSTVLDNRTVVEKTHSDTDGEWICTELKF